VTGASGRDECDRLLETCQSLLTREEWADAHWWARGTAHLARQAMETLLDDYWEVHAPALTRASLRARFLALHAFIGDARLVGEGYATWSQLSRACHAQGYDLAPTGPELQGWVDGARRFCDALRAAARGGA